MVGESAIRQWKTALVTPLCGPLQMETASRAFPAHGAPTIHLRGTASTWITHIFADPFVVADPTRRAVKSTKRMVHFIVPVTTRIVRKTRTVLACTRFVMATWAGSLVVNVHFAPTAVSPTIAQIKGMARELDDNAVVTKTIKAVLD